ncbi:sigma factor [Alteromonas sp. ASW11-36]|uniref:RNA polymerase sigma factor n=1 Tax=Alteromonas arenosi TaxID=3055817 RepID=A0ABT7SWI7_9ALTE|nr:DUF6596 domain-containing protein [Alteromonas sp. ASW11-36]MDM7860544.1 sigma factor [Alteromonas sp. ASW11-36]
MSETVLHQRIAQALQQSRGQLTGVLLRLVGPSNLDLAQDIVQDTFIQALERWPLDGIPQQPTAWLTTVAKRKTLDALRAQDVRLKYAERLAEPLTSEWTVSSTVEKAFDAAVITDDELRLLFWLSSADMPQHNRLPLVLKTLCGMDAKAVSRALLLPLETVKKRLVRAKQAIQSADFSIPEETHLPNALHHVHLALYLMFNETVNQAGPDLATRELIATTVRGYLRIILDHKEIASSGSYALMAIIQFHMARWPARFDEHGEMVAIDEQNRAIWHTGLFIDAAKLLEQALDMPQTEASQRFLLEALITYEHSRASSFTHTQWSLIVDYYHKWYLLEPTPPVAINLAVAQAQHGDINAALATLENVDSRYSPAIAARVLATQAFVSALSKDSIKAKLYRNKCAAAGLPTKALAGLDRQIKKLLSD